MIILIYLVLLISSLYSDEISPYKFKNFEDLQKTYDVATSSLLKIKRGNGSDITCYISKPKSNEFPFVILTSGSQQKNSLYSNIHIHRYFLEELLNLGLGVITIEQQGNN